MMPASTVLDLFPKMVRDLAKAQGKEIEWVAQGADLDVDRKVLETMKDPLIHLVRNAIDHGIESRADFVSRFSLDSFRQSRWVPYAGGGLSGRFRSLADGGAKGYLLVFLGIEGPLPDGKMSGWAPAVEVGLGGGARVGLILRRGINGRR